MLVPCKPDDIMLAEKVQENILRLNTMHMKVCGSELQVEPGLLSDYGRFLNVRKRHSQGDFRWSEDEKKAVRSIADWTLWVLYALQEQVSANQDPGGTWTAGKATPPKPIEWKD